MMTPGGLVHNLLIDSMSSLKVYYFLEPNGNIEFTSARFLILSILMAGLIGLTFMYSSLVKKESSQEAQNEV